MFSECFYDFEKLYEEAKEMMVWDLIGNPEYKKAEELNDNQLSAELRKLLKTIHMSKISVKFQCLYDERTKYRFITEELFLKIVKDVKIKGMKHMFLYEDFHPNHEYDIRYLTEKFIEYVIADKKGITFPADHLLDSTINFRNTKIQKEYFLKITSSFRENFKDIRLEHLHIETVEADLKSKTGKVTGEIAYTFYIENKDKEIISGKFLLNVFLVDNRWKINGVEIPGIV